MDGTVWNYRKNRLAPRDPEAAAFLEALEALCKEHNFSISHQDGGGAFILTPYDQHTMDWLKRAGQDF